MAYLPILTFTDVVGPIHANQELCQQLLSNIDTAATLEILPSKIDNNGTGLFAKESIPEGADIFRSTPLVTCVGDGMHSILCDFCLTSSASKINPDGHFRTKGDVMPKISRCAQCGVCRYCSKVRRPTRLVLIWQHCVY